jgi:hypothetical protein
MTPPPRRCHQQWARRALVVGPSSAGSAIVGFGADAAAWGMVAATAPQRPVPDLLRDRIGSVHSLLVMGASAVVALVDGAPSSVWPGGAALPVKLEGRERGWAGRPRTRR